MATAGVPATKPGSEMVAAGSGSAGREATADSGADGCTRALLQRSLDSYFVALAAHDPAMLPLAEHVKLTENGKTLELGKAGLWSTAGAQQHVHSALDTDRCTAIAQAVVPDGTTPIPVALRLKLEQQQISEIEMIAVREGDYMLASNTKALSASAMSVHWQDMVPLDQRNTRDELAAWRSIFDCSRAGCATPPATASASKMEVARSAAALVRAALRIHLAPMIAL
jgi:hypothetical protein